MVKVYGKPLRVNKAAQDRNTQARPLPPHAAGGPHTAAAWGLV